MATMYLSDAHKAEARVIRDDKAEIRRLKEELEIYNDFLELYQGVTERADRLICKLKLALGGLIGIDILLSIIWYSTT